MQLLRANLRPEAAVKGTPIAENRADPPDYVDSI